MGRSTLLIVLAAIVGGSYLTFNVLRTQTETTGRRSNAQANVLARQLAESGQAIALSSITGLDGFSNGGVFVSDRDYNGGKIRFEDYDDTLPSSTPNGERVAIQVSGQYGGATHRLSSVYEFDPMDFPGPLWIDVPYAAGNIHPNASFSGGTFGYQPQVAPDKYNDLDIASLGLSLNGIKSAINGTGASVPAWDISGTSNDGFGRTADLGSGVTSADDLYYQVMNAIDTSADDVEIAGPHTVTGSTTYGAADAITHIKGDLTISSGGRLTGQGALIVEGDLDVQGRMRWSGLVIVRSTEQALTINLKQTEIIGAFVVSQEAFPPGGHMDVTVYREPTGGNTAPYGQRAAGPGSLSASPWSLSTPFPFWHHTHKFDFPTAGQPDFLARSERVIRFVDDDAGDPQESYTGLRELLDHLGSEQVYVEFDNLGKNGHSIVEMEVDGLGAIERGVAMGFAETPLEGSARYRSRVFDADELERLVVRPQSLRSLRKLWDPNGVCTGASPPEWPMCVGYDRNDREGSLTMRIRRASGGAMLYESAIYWHMQSGQEHTDYQADVAAWQAAVSSGTTPFGTTFTMSSNSSMTYDIVPIVSLAEKVGFRGNQVIHISTESGLSEASQMATGPAPSTSPAPPAASTTTGGSAPAPSNPLDTSGGGTTTVCHSGAPLSIARLTLSLHLLHNDTVGGCPDVPPSSQFDDIVVCHSGSSIAVRMLDYGTHIDHGDSFGACSAGGGVAPSGPTAGTVAPIEATPSQAIPTNNQEWVMMCHAPYGSNPNWRTEEVKYHQFLNFRTQEPGSVLGPCSDHGL